MSSTNDASYKFAMNLIEKGITQSPDEIGYELISEEFGVLGYEAEMVWKEKKVAVLANDDPDTLYETVTSFENNGWKVFVIGKNKIETVVQALHSNGGS